MRPDGPFKFNLTKPESNRAFKDEELRRKFEAAENKRDAKKRATQEAAAPLKPTEQETVEQGTHPAAEGFDPSSFDFLTDPSANRKLAIEIKKIFEQAGISQRLEVAAKSIDYRRWEREKGSIDYPTELGKRIAVAKKDAYDGSKGLSEALWEAEDAIAKLEAIAKEYPAGSN